MPTIGSHWLCPSCSAGATTVSGQGPASSAPHSPCTFGALSLVPSLPQQHAVPPRVPNLAKPRSGQGAKRSRQPGEEDQPAEVRRRRHTAVRRPEKSRSRSNSEGGVSRPVEGLDPSVVGPLVRLACFGEFSSGWKAQINIRGRSTKRLVAVPAGEGSSAMDLDG